MDVASEAKVEEYKATFCEIIWYLSKASLVFSEASEMPLPTRSEAADEDDGREETPDSFKQN